MQKSGLGSVAVDRAARRNTRNCQRCLEIIHKSKCLSETIDNDSQGLSTFCVQEGLAAVSIGSKSGGFFMCVESLIAVDGSEYACSKWRTSKGIVTSGGVKSCARPETFVGGQKLDSVLTNGVHCLNPPFAHVDCDDDACIVQFRFSCWRT
eukprot:4288581-Amphidinium_carterae.1